MSQFVTLRSRYGLSCMVVHAMIGDSSRWLMIHPNNWWFIPMIGDSSRWLMIHPNNWWFIPMIGDSSRWLMIHPEKCDIVLYPHVHVHEVFGNFSISVIGWLALEVPDWTQMMCPVNRHIICIYYLHHLRWVRHLKSFSLMGLLAGWMTGGLCSMTGWSVGLAEGSDWVTGQTGWPVGLGDRSDWVTGRTGWAVGLGDRSDWVTGRTGWPVGLGDRSDCIAINRWPTSCHIIHPRSLNDRQFIFSNES